MALRIFRRKDDDLRPAGDRIPGPAGDRIPQPAMGSNGQGWSRPLEAEVDAALARTKRGKGGRPATATRSKGARTSKGKSQKAKGSRKPAKSAKQATNRKPASKPKKGGRRSR